MALAALLAACNNADSSKEPTAETKADKPAAVTAPATDTTGGYILAKGEFYCEGMVAADGLGCMIKIDGVVYKMQWENQELYEDGTAFEKAGKPVQMEILYKKDGTKFKLMNGSDGPELLTIKQIKPVQ